jgi:outer membrane protein assembly factor BamB
VIVLLACISDIYAQEWPQYLGPNRNGVSAQKGILRTWPQQGPQVLWSVDVGIGFGGPVVKDGKVYLLDRDDKAGDKLRCFDLSSGKELWNFGYEAPGSVMFPGSRSVPTLDGNRIYSCGPYGNLYCIDINTHKPIWNKNVDRFRGLRFYIQLSVSFSFGNLLICFTGSQGRSCYWRKADRQGWRSTPLVL